MVRLHAGAFLEGLDRIFNEGTVAGLSEGELLERFVATADETAFAALVSRHGPMVLGVCRRALRDEHDVEDAFQATFLVLVRRAARSAMASVWGTGFTGSLIGWQSGAANAARRRLCEQTGIKIDPALDQSPPLDDVPAILDDELVRLPDSLRAPTVLCYLEGLTHDEAAQRLEWPGRNRPQPNEPGSGTVATAAHPSRRLGRRRGVVPVTRVSTSLNDLVQLNGAVRSGHLLPKRQPPPF